MSIMVGVGKGAAAGVLIRSAEALERLEKMDTLVVDKTGTLTEGKPRVVDIKPSGGWPEDDLLRLAASLERSSEHPLAAAVVALARQRDFAIAEADDFLSVTGKGVTGTVDGTAVALGNVALMNDLGIVLGALEADAEALRREGATALFLAVDAAPAGIIAIADPIKATTHHALADLRARGILIVMLTGDNRDHCGSCRARPRHQADRGRCAAGRQARCHTSSESRQGKLSLWQATASTTPPHWPRRISVSPWAPAPKLRWRVPASPW